MSPPLRAWQGPKSPRAIFLMGPTASGKTGLAVSLVEQFPLDIISVDSAQIYRGMDIGTAKPDAATLARAPHRLIDIRDPLESYSAAEFRRDATVEMERIWRVGRIPLLVGGSMLYFRALAGGLADLPSADPAARERLAREAEAIGWAGMHERLRDLDPLAASRIHPKDPQRIQRALEVIELTGRKMSELQMERSEAEPLPAGFHPLKLVVCPTARMTLHQRIEARFQAMLDRGLVGEVAALRARGDLSPRLPSMRCVAYRQAWSHLEGAIGLAEMCHQSVVASRQLAKRQLTWLRQDSEALWYDLGSDLAQESVFERVSQWLE